MRAGLACLAQSGISANDITVNSVTGLSSSGATGTTSMSSGSGTTSITSSCSGSGSGSGSTGGTGGLVTATRPAASSSEPSGTSSLSISLNLGSGSGGRGGRRRRLQDGTTVNTGFDGLNDLVQLFEGDASDAATAASRMSELEWRAASVVYHLGSALRQHFLPGGGFVMPQTQTQASGASGGSSGIAGSAGAGAAPVAVNYTRVAEVVASIQPPEASPAYAALGEWLAELGGPGLFAVQSFEISVGSVPIGRITSGDAPQTAAVIMAAIPRPSPSPDAASPTAEGASSSGGLIAGILIALLIAFAALAALLLIAARKRRKRSAAVKGKAGRGARRSYASALAGKYDSEDAEEGGGLGGQRRSTFVANPLAAIAAASPDANNGSGAAGDANGDADGGKLGSSSVTARNPMRVLLDASDEQKLGSGRRSGVDDGRNNFGPMRTATMRLGFGATGVGGEDGNAGDGAAAVGIPEAGTADGESASQGQQRASLARAQSRRGVVRLSESGIEAMTLATPAAMPKHVALATAVGAQLGSGFAARALTRSKSVRLDAGALTSPSAASLDGADGAAVDAPGSDAAADAAGAAPGSSRRRALLNLGDLDGASASRRALGFGDDDDDRRGFGASSARGFASPSARNLLGSGGSDGPSPFAPSRTSSIKTLSPGDDDAMLQLGPGGARRSGSGAYNGRDAAHTRVGFAAQLTGGGRGAGATRLRKAVNKLRVANALAGSARRSGDDEDSEGEGAGSAATGRSRNAAVPHRGGDEERGGGFAAVGAVAVSIANTEGNVPAAASALSAGGQAAVASALSAFGRARTAAPAPAPLPAPPPAMRSSDSGAGGDGWSDSEDEGEGAAARAAPAPAPKPRSAAAADEDESWGDDGDDAAHAAPSASAAVSGAAPATRPAAADDESWGDDDAPSSASASSFAPAAPAPPPLPPLPPQLRAAAAAAVAVSRGSLKRAQSIKALAASRVVSRNRSRFLGGVGEGDEEA